MINFLKDILAHSDDIAYGAGSELYNKMVVDTEDRHKKFTRWGNEVQNSLNLRKRELQAEEKNYNSIISKIKSKTDKDINDHVLSEGIDLDTYLAPLDSQLGTGLFLGEEKDILPKIKYFLKNTPIKKDTPYVPSQTYFADNFGKLDAQMQKISGLGYNTWRSLTKKGELSMVEDVKPVEFSDEDKVKARADLELTLKNYDMWGEAGTPTQNNYSMFGKYLLIKKDAQNQATNANGELDFRKAIAIENELIKKEEIDINQLGAFFGVDQNIIRQMSIQGNFALTQVSNLVSEAAMIKGTDPNAGLKRAEIMRQARALMKNAVDHAVMVNEEAIKKFGKVGEFDNVKSTSRAVVAKIKAILPENSKEFFNEYLKVTRNQESQAQTHPFGNDMYGQGKVNYAYTKLNAATGVRTWYMIDSYGVEINTRVKESDLSEKADRGIVYETLNKSIADQMKEGHVSYTDPKWALTVARQLGYQIDEKTGMVVKVRGKDVTKVSDALYHGFRTEKFEDEKEQKEAIDTDIYIP